MQKSWRHYAERSPRVNRRSGAGCGMLGAMTAPRRPLSVLHTADIHAWLQSLPKAPDYKSIPLLNP